MGSRAAAPGKNSVLNFVAGVEGQERAGVRSERSQKGRVQMSIFLALPILAATGIYNPQVMHHGRCIAEPGSIEALYCHPQAATPRRKHAKTASR